MTGIPWTFLWRVSRRHRRGQAHRHRALLSVRTRATPSAFAGTCVTRPVRRPVSRAIGIASNHDASLRHSIRAHESRLAQDPSSRHHRSQSTFAPSSGQLRCLTSYPARILAWYCDVRACADRCRLLDSAACIDGRPNTHALQQMGRLPEGCPGDNCAYDSCGPKLGSAASVQYVDQ